MCSYNQLFKEFLNDDNFIACGSEFYPIDMRKIRKSFDTEKIQAAISEPKLYVIKNSKPPSQTKSTQTTEGIAKCIGFFV